MSDGVLVWLPSHQVTINDKMERQINNLKKILIGSPFSPPPRSELENALGKTTIDTLVELEILIPLTSDIIFLSTTYQEVLAQVRKFICEHGSISVAQLGISLEQAGNTLLHFWSTSINRISLPDRAMPVQWRENEFC